MVFFLGTTVAEVGTTEVAARLDYARRAAYIQANWRRSGPAGNAPVWFCRPIPKGNRLKRLLARHYYSRHCPSGGQDRFQRLAMA